MQTRGRALYNLIRMNWLEDKHLPAEEWQFEDYRSLSTDELFHRLFALHISLDEERFQHFAEAVSSPEELIETLWIEEDSEQFDKAYLLIFELWRRLMPEKQSLSIFCDELDHLIDRYDASEVENIEEIHEALGELERVLDEHADQGEDPKKLFEEISYYCAHELESFIYDFASDEIDHDNPLNASELIEGFAPYIKNAKWFELLELRLLASTDPEEAEAMLERLIKEQEEEPDFELLLEIARFLVHRGDIVHFLNLVKRARNLIEVEQDFQELLAINCEFYRLLDRDQESEKMGELLKKRQGISLEKEMSPNDPHFKEYFKLIEDFGRSEA